MKTSGIAVETSRTTTQSDSIVRQTNKCSSCLSYTTMNNKQQFFPGAIRFYIAKILRSKIKVDEILKAQYQIKAYVKPR